MSGYQITSSHKFWGIDFDQISLTWLKFWIVVKILGINFQWPINLGVLFSRKFASVHSDFRRQMAHPPHPSIEVTPRGNS